MKDVPTWLVPGTILPCTLPREDTRDAWISPSGKLPQDLPDGAARMSRLRRPRRHRLRPACATRGTAGVQEPGQGQGQGGAGRGGAGWGGAGWGMAQLHLPAATRPVPCRSQ